MIALSIGGEMKPIFKAIKALADFAVYPSHKDREWTQACLMVLSAFTKAGQEDFLGITPSRPVQPMQSSKVRKHPFCSSLPDKACLLQEMPHAPFAQPVYEGTSNH